MASEQAMKAARFLMVGGTRTQDFSNAADESEVLKVAESIDRETGLPDLIKRLDVIEKDREQLRAAISTIANRPR